MRKHLFITGIARSGTTLVANLLNSQPRMSVWSDGMSGPIMAAQRLGGFARTLSPRERNVALSWVKFEQQRAAHKVLQAAPDSFRSVGELYDAALEALARPEDLLVGHKVNAFGPHSNVFWQLLEHPHVHVVCVVRDIRDVVCSQRNHLHETMTPLSHWQTIAHHEARLHAHPRCTLLRFEDVISNAAAGLAPLAQQLQVTIDVGVKELRHREQPWLENSAFHDVDRLFDPRVVGRFRNHLDDEQVRRAAYLCRHALSKLRYPEFPVPWSLRERLAHERNRAGGALLTQAAEGLRRLRTWVRP